jgi:hypothetical protein
LLTTESPRSAQRWPGGGTTLLLRIEGESGSLRKDFSKNILLSRAGADTPYISTATRVSLPPGHTIVVVIPPSSIRHNSEIATAVSVFVQSRPDSERISIYRWGQQLQQLRDISTDRGDLLSVFDIDSVLKKPEHYLSAFKAVSYLDNSRLYPSRLRFIFSYDQREVFRKFIKGKSKDSFQLAVLPDGSPRPASATAHLRGTQSLSCRRKSYALEFNDDLPRYLMPRSATSAFYLLSPCRDAHLVHQYTTLQVWKELGLFPFEFRFIELQIEDEPFGAYLLIEKASEKLWQIHGRVQSILRKLPDSTWKTHSRTGCSLKRLNV